MSFLWIVKTDRLFGLHLFVLTGLPISEHDHGKSNLVTQQSREQRKSDLKDAISDAIPLLQMLSLLGVNGIFFGDNGELYIQVGRYVMLQTELATNSLFQNTHPCAYAYAHSTIGTR